MALNSISILLPVVGETADRVKFVESMSLRAIALFGMLTGAILSSTALPKDIEDQSILSIITKPVNRINLLFGKALGFIYIVGITTILLSCFSILFIRLTASDYSSKEVGTSLLTARREAVDLNFSIEGEHKKSPGGIEWVEGGKGSAVWTIFLGGKQQGKDLEVELEYYIEGDEKFVTLQADVFNPATEDRVSRVVNAGIGNKLSLQFDRKMSSVGDKLIFELTPENSGEFIGIVNSKVKFFFGSVNFEYNFAKAITIILFQIVLIIFIGVTGSTFLITPSVSISFVLFILFCGYMVEYISDFESVLDFQGVHDHGHGHEHEQESFVGESGILLTFLDLALKHIFNILTFAVPDLNKFDTELFITNRIDIPLKKVGSLFCYSFVYILSFTAISAAIIRRKEI